MKRTKEFSIKQVKKDKDMKTVQNVSDVFVASRWDNDLQFKTLYRNSNAILKRKQSMLPRVVPIARNGVRV